MDGILRTHVRSASKWKERKEVQDPATLFQVLILVEFREPLAAFKPLAATASFVVINYGVITRNTIVFEHILHLSTFKLL